MKTNFFSKVSLLALVMLLGFSTAALAQKLDGALRGEITDAQGAVVTDAKVSVTNTATGISQSTQTSSSGTYFFPNLLVGNYDLTVEKKGFKKYVNRGITVAASAVREAHAKLEVGSENTTVEVVAGIALIQTESSQLTNTFSTRLSQELPISALGGSPLELATLAPNTTQQGGGVLGQGGSIGGTRPRLNSFTIDGTDNNDVSVTGPVQPVIQDSVAEFSLLTNQFSAEYGQAGGGQFALVTKSGGNNAHGELHFYGQNRHLNADPSVPKGRFDYARTGVSVGGPILKDKLFFYGAYEYQTNGVASGGVSQDSPTSAGLATLQGLAAANPSITDILNQFPTASAATDQECVNGSNPGRLSSQVTACGANGGTLVDIGQVALTAPDFLAQHDFITNLDLNIGKHQIRGRFLFDRQRSPNVNPDTPLAQFTGAIASDNKKLIMTDVYAINNHWVNDFRAGYTRQTLNFGVPAIFGNFPNAEVDTLGINIGPEGNSPQASIANIYQFTEQMTYSHGRHTFKWGAEFHNWIAPSGFLPRGRGEWDYANLTELVNDAIPSGLNGALRGAGASTFAGNQQGYFFFFQDDWKLTSRLTLNLGLRYELVTIPRDDATQALNSIADCPTCTAAGFSPGALLFHKPKRDSNNFSPRVGFAWDPTGSRKWAIRGGGGVYFDKEPQNFPLLSLPPQLQTEQNPSLTCTINPALAFCPAGATPGFNFLASGGLLQVNVPCTTTVDCQSATQGIIVDEVKPKTITWTFSVQRELFKRTSLEVRYLGTAGISLPVQARFNTISGFEAGLTGLPTFFNVSDIPATFPLTQERRTAWTNHLNCVTTCFLRFAGPGGVGGFDGGFVTGFPKTGHSTYHSLSTDFIHDFDHGLYLRANYTWAHTIDNATNELFSSRVNPRRPQDWNNLSADRGRSVLDIRHKFALSWVYEVPKLHTDSGFGKALLHGWQVNGTFVAQKGQPITPLSGTDSNGNGDSAGDRAIFNPAGDPTLGSGVHAVCMFNATGVSLVSSAATSCRNAFNALIPLTSVVGYVAVDPTAGWVQAQRGAISTAGRDSVSSPGLGLLNLSIYKNTHMSESKYFQFRLEMYNALNHRNFTLANLGIIGLNSNALSTTYANVSAGANFLNAKQFSGGFRTVQLGIKFIF